MAQIFSRSADTWLRVGLLLLIAGLSGGLLVVLTLDSTDYRTGHSWVVEQPLPFSHAHHAGELKIDCRYCHSAVQSSAVASLPPTETCMSCHSQIWADSPMLEPVRASFRTGQSLEWTRVHDLPGFVYFNHGIHVSKGVGCATCHGRVDQMPLMWKENTLHMEWCLNCHRNPEQYVRPKDQVFRMDYQPAEDQLALGAKLVKEYKIRKLTDCSVCHR